MATSNRLPRTHQENLLALLCFDDKNGRVVSNLIGAELFEGDYRDFAEAAIQYWREYNQAPKDHLPDLLSHVLEDEHNRKAPTYRSIFGQLIDLSENINAEFSLSRLHAYIRYQNWRSTILEAAETLQQRGEDGIDEIEELVNKQLVSRQLVFDAGLRLSDTERALSFFEIDRDIIKTGITDLDIRHVCPRRKELFIMIAPRKRGKSWFLVHLGKMALMQRKKVVHITLEISEEITAQRYIQAWFSVSKRPAKILQSFLERDELDRLSGLELEEVEPELTFQDPKAREQLKMKLEAWNRRLGNLIIKQFPTGQLTPRALEGYLDNLEIVHRFIPDLIIVDYAQIMKVNSSEPRFSYGHNVELLRGICVARNMAGVSAWQSNRKGAESATVVDTHIAEDFSVLATCDNAVTYSQTEAEKKLNLARLTVSAARNEEDRFTLLLTQSYQTGQFVLDSILMRNNYWDYLKELGGDEDEDEN